MKKFYIDIAYVVDVIVRTEHTIKKGWDESSEDFLIRKLKYEAGSMYSISHTDHDEFTKLRNLLEDSKYIITERGWWNGDRVIRPFYLNDVKFSKGDKFCCACAMKWVLERGKSDK